MLWDSLPTTDILTAASGKTPPLPSLAFPLPCGKHGIFGSGRFLLDPTNDLLML